MSNTQNIVELPLNILLDERFYGPIDMSTRATIGLTMLNRTDSVNYIIPTTNANGILLNDGTGALSWAPYGGLGSDTITANNADVNGTLKLIQNGIGDSSIRLAAPSATYYMGYDQSADKFKVSKGIVGLGTGDILIADPDSASLLRDNALTTPSLTLEQAGVGDSGVCFQAGGDSYIMGIDQSAGQFKLSHSTVLGTNDIFTSAGGAVVFNNITLPETATDGSVGVLRIGTTRFIALDATENIFIGTDAGAPATTGLYNLGIGHSSLGGIVDGDHNVASGYQSGMATTTGNNNTFTGYKSGLANTTGSDNTCIGNMSNCSGGALLNATAIGSGAIVSESNKMQFGSAAIAKVAFGTSTVYTIDEISALHNFYVSSGLNYCIGGGNRSAAGIGNIWLGGTGNSGTSGSGNVMLGYAAGSATNTGGFNTFVGYNASNTNTSGSNNTSIGYGSNVGVAGARRTAIGYNAVSSVNDGIVLGNASAMIGIRNASPAEALDVGGNVLTSGNITLSAGNIVLAPGATVDTVDVSTFKADYDSKVNQDVRTGSYPVFQNITDLKFSGFHAWAGPVGPYWSYVPLTHTFTLLRSGEGYVQGQHVVFSAGQSLVLADFQAEWIYIDPAGILRSIPAIDEAFFQNNFLIFTFMSDSVNYIVKRDDHNYNFPTSLFFFFHMNLGSIIRGEGAILTKISAGLGVAITDAQIAMAGDDVFEDQSLNTNIPDTAGAPISLFSTYINALGHWIQSSYATELPLLWNNAGVPQAIGAGNRGVYRIFATGDSLNNPDPRYIAIMNTAEYINLADAEAAIAAGTVFGVVGYIDCLDMAQLGFAIVRNSGQPEGYIEEIIIQKDAFSAKYISGGGGVGNHLLLAGLNAGTYGDGGHTNLVQRHVASAVPTFTDDATSYKRTALWLDETPTPSELHEVYVNVDNTLTAAVWKRIAWSNMDIVQIGSGALALSNTVALGLNAGQSSIAGSAENTFIGHLAGSTNTTGTHNIAVGYNALVGTTGARRTAIGYNSVSSIDDGLILGDINTLVGIRTSSPTEALDVVGNVSMTRLILRDAIDLSNKITIQVPNIALDQTLTLPSVLPAATTYGVLESDSTGALTWNASPTLVSPRVKTSLIIEDPGVGGNSITVGAPAALSGSYNIILPDMLPIPTKHGFLESDDSGNCTWIEAPTDMNISGFSQWDVGASAPYWSYAKPLGVPTLTIIWGGYGYIQGRKITFTAGQTVEISYTSNNYIVVDATGTVVRVPYTPAGLIENYILLFQVYDDGAMLSPFVNRNTHPVSFPSDVADFLHQNVGTVLTGPGGVISPVLVGTGASANNRRIQISGGQVADHGLFNIFTAINPISMKCYYLNAINNWTQNILDAAVPGFSDTIVPIVYENAGIPTILSAGYHGVVKMYITMDSYNTNVPQFVGIINNAQFATHDEAQTAISNGLIRTVTAPLDSMELAELGYVITRNSGVNGYIEEIIIEKSTFNSQYIGGAVPMSHVTLSGLNNTKYWDGGHTYMTTRIEHAAIPNATNDANETGGSPSYKTLSLWLDTTPAVKDIYICIDNTTSAAIWPQLITGLSSDLGANLLISTTPITTAYRSALVGTDNTIIGKNAGSAMTGGVGNTIIGSGSGSLVSTGSYNTAIGASTAVGSSSTYRTAIGYGAVSSVNNGMVLGDSNVLVGIRTSTPAYALDVNGYVKTSTGIIIEDPGVSSNAITLVAPTLVGSYSITLPTSVGANGKLLKTTDGAGTLAWTTNTRLDNLTDTEITQLENINASAISTTQWGYLSALNQSLTQTSDVLFADITATKNQINTIAAFGGVAAGNAGFTFGRNATSEGELAIQGNISTPTFTDMVAADTSLRATSGTLRLGVGPINTNASTLSIQNGIIGINIAPVAAKALTVKSNIALYNAAGTFYSDVTSLATVNRTVTFPDRNLSLTTPTWTDSISLVRNTQTLTLAASAVASGTYTITFPPATNASSGMLLKASDAAGTLAWTTSTRLDNLTDTEITQLENINASTISTTQWGYLSALDQSVASGASPTWVSPLLKTSLLLEDPGVGVTTITIGAPSGLVGSYSIVLPGSLPAASTFGVLESNSSGTTTWNPSPTLISPLIKTSLLIEDPGAGTNKITLQGPTLAGNYSLTLPTALPSASPSKTGYLQTDNTTGTCYWNEMPYDGIQSGWAQWTAGATSPFWSYTKPTFTLIYGGYGYIRGKKITWGAGLTVACSTLAENTIYITSGGVLTSGVYSAGLEYDNIVLFNLYDDNVMATPFVRKQNHSVSFSQTMQVLFDATAGSILSNTGGVVAPVLTGTGASPNNRRVQISGATVYDADLSTIIPAVTTSPGITIDCYYLNGSNKWIRNTQDITPGGVVLFSKVDFTQLPLVYANAGTITGIPNNNYAVIRLYVVVDSLNTTSPQYIGIIDSQQGNLATAQARITANTAVAATYPLSMMDLAQLGQFIVRNVATNGHIAQTTLGRSVIGATSTAGTISSHLTLADLNGGPAGDSSHTLLGTIRTAAAVPNANNDSAATGGGTTQKTLSHWLDTTNAANPDVYVNIVNTATAAKWPQIITGLASDTNSNLYITPTSVTTTFRSALVGTQNTFVGKLAGSSTTSGSGNTSMGYNAGFNITTGSTNVFVGSNSNGTAGISNQIAIGNGTTTSGADGIAIGRNSTAAASGLAIGLTATAATGIAQIGTAAGFQFTTANISCSTGWTNASDRRLKSEIHPLDSTIVSNFISKLEPVMYNTESKDKIVTKSCGFIAQDVEQACLSTGFDGQIVSINPETGYYQMSYQLLHAVAIKGLQEQAQKIKHLEDENIDLKSQIKRILEYLNL